MMKYRVWDKKKKEYVYGANDYRIAPDGSLFKRVWCLFWIESDDEVEFYSGYDSKHGDPVYDGDFFYCNGAVGDYPGKACVNLVRYKDGAFRIVKTNCDYSGGGSCEHIGDTIDNWIIDDVDEYSYKEHKNRRKGMV